MITYILYNKGTPGERVAAQFEERLKLEQIDTELVDADSSRGIGLVETYDIMGRPAVILLKDDGAPVQVWQGEDGLPAPSEVAYLAHL